VAIVKLEIENYRSFKKLDFTLGQFNVIVGANASGKSNIVSAFQFLRTIPPLGLRDAILTSGGGSLFKYARAGAEPVRFSITCVQSMVPGAREGKGDPGSGAVRATYSFSLKVGKKAGNVTVKEDRLVLEFLENEWKDVSNRRSSRSASTLTFSHGKGRVEVSETRVSKDLRITKDLGPLLDALRNTPMGNTTLLLENPLMQPLFAGPFQDLLGSSIFSINPASTRGINIDVGKPVLDITGANLAMVLGRLLDTPVKRSRFLRIVKATLPVIEDIRPARFGNIVIFRVKERGGREYFTADSMSEGTLSTLALIVALFFEEKSFVIIEEPERNLHPLLLSRLIDLMRDESTKRQLVITTHSPTFVEGSGLDSLCLLSRAKDGSSHLSRPADSSAVKAFLRQDIGLGTLFSRDLISS